MDETNYFLLKRLIENSRVTYRELADMNIAFKAKYSRNILRKERIIIFQALPSFSHRNLKILDFLKHLYLLLPFHGLSC